MRRTFVVAGAVLCLALGGCSGQDKGDASSAQGQTTPTAAATGPAQAGAASAVGSTVELAGQQDGEKLAVTLVKIVDPAPGADEFMKPDAGNRFVAAQFNIKNTGTVPYQDAPANRTRIVDSAGKECLAQG